ncbi:MAG: GMC family oxidoreductase [Bacteroidota bacterium]
MIYDGRSFLGGPSLNTQVCIVGTGQAGITLAWYLLDKGIDVTLLEGSRVFSPGGPDNPVQDAYLYNENELLYNGQSLGLFASNEPEFLIRPTPQYFNNTKERERIYGGTSTHWGGQARPLDPITFEKRPGFPGWPITREDLDPYYAEACKFVGLYGDYYAPDGAAGYNFTAEFWAKELGQQVADMQGFDVDMYQFVPSQNLQFQARKVNGKTIGESNARVILNATLLQIENQGGSVSSLTIGVMSDDRQSPQKAGEFTIQADVYVLACGAVANARQLLLSDVGNEKDLVGRYLMGHPIANKDGFPANAVSTNPNYLNPSEQQLLSYQNPNNIHPGKYPISLVAGLLTPNAEAARANQSGRCWFGPSGTGNFYHGLLPARESRITLSDMNDPVFGQRQSKAIWVLSDDAARNYNALTQLFKTAVQLKGGGPVSINDWDNVKTRMVFNGHHLGTTRMSETAADGVVDQNLKVHSMDNLYCAGSSIWATAGISNPTFSIITFSIRLAEHLASSLQENSTGGTTGLFKRAGDQ